LIHTTFKLGKAALIDSCLDRQPVLHNFPFLSKSLDFRAD